MANIEPIVGRYVWVTYEGTEYRMYFEEAGNAHFQGDCFVFAGRVLEYVRTQDMVAFVKKSSGKRGMVPSWQGGKMPLSSELADAGAEPWQSRE